MDLYMFFLFNALPSFAFILFAKCVDLFSYKKRCMTSKWKRFMMIGFLILVVAYLLNAIASSLFLTSENGTWQLLSLFSPLSMPILTLIPMYLLERKCIKDEAQKNSLKTRFFIVDLVLSFAFVVSYIDFGFWSLSTFGEIGLLGSKVDNTKENIVSSLGTLVLFIIFALIKIAMQSIISRKNSKNRDSRRK